MNANLFEIGRYIASGLVATAVHYTVLTINWTIIDLPSAGLSNLIAALFGISTSFLGNRYFVFQSTHEPVFRQAVKFSGLYGIIAVLHGLVLLIWTDWYDLDYNTGFLIAVAIQFCLGYVGSKVLVFKL